MKVFVDEENRIKDVHSTSDPTLKELDINDKNNPFSGWSIAKICCYKVTVMDGEVTGFTPYVSSSLLSVVDNLGHKIDEVVPYKKTKKAYIRDTQIRFFDVPKGNISVFMANDKDVYPDYSVKRMGDKVVVTFSEPLIYLTDITLTIQ